MRVRLCRSLTRPATVAYATTIEHDGRAYRVEIPALKAPQCGHCRAMSIDDEADPEISATFRREARLLTPAEIRQGRDVCGKVGEEVKETAFNLN